MKLEDCRSEFFTYVVNADSQAEMFRQRGYRVQTFKTEKELIAEAQKTPPHFIVGGFLGLDFLEEIKNLSPEIKVIAAHPENKLSAVQVADTAARQFLLQIEQEDEEHQGVATAFSPAVIKDDTYFDRAEKFFSKKYFTPDLALGHLVEAASELIGGKPVVFLKYVPAHQALLLKKAFGLNEEGVRSVGVPLQYLNTVETEKILSEDPSQLGILKEMLQEVFGLLEYTLYPVKLKSKPYGVLILFRPLRTENNKRLMNFYLDVVQSKVEQLETEKTLFELNTHDLTTGLDNEKSFDKKLTEEVSRARRIEQPVNLIIFELDHFQKYKEKNGEAMADVIVKSITQLIKKNCRNTDILARLSSDKFAILCPHSTLKGVADKAERLRLVIESTPFPRGERQPLGKLTASFGVSGFPDSSQSAEMLAKSAEEALHRVRQGGKNRVCLAEAPRGFVPEFGADVRT